MIVDTSALLAYFDTDEPDHQAVAAILEGTDEPLVVSPYVVAELDYLVASRLGATAELAALAELAGEIKATRKMSLADCFAAALARTRDAELYTGDPEFKAVEGYVKIVWLGR